MLAHKPAQLEEVAREAAPAARAVVSLLARTSLDQLRAAYPGTRSCGCSPTRRPSWAAA